MRPTTDRKRARMSGILDIFRRKRPPEPPPPAGAVVPAAPPEPPLPGLIETVGAVFAEPPPTPAGLVARAAEIFVAPPAVTPPATAPSAFERALEVFRPPEPPTLPPPEILPTAPPMELVEAFFEPVAEEMPLEAIFGPMEPAPAAPVPEAFGWPKAYEEWLKKFPDIAEATGGRAPRWLGAWEPDAASVLSDRIRGRWPDLAGLFDWVRMSTSDPAWWRLAEEAAHTGEPPALPVERVALAGWNAYADLARWLGIPDHVVDRYAGPDPEDAQFFWVEAMRPMFKRFTKAMDLLRPPDLARGWFELAPVKGGDWWIVYREAPFRPELPLGT